MKYQTPISRPVRSSGRSCKPLTSSLYLRIDEPYSSAAAASSGLLPLQPGRIARRGFNSILDIKLGFPRLHSSWVAYNETFAY